MLSDASRAYQESSDLSLEKPCLINPKVEDPSQFISFHIDRSGDRFFVTAVPRAGIDSNNVTRANETIIIVGLNSNEHGYDLVQERGNDFSRSDFENIVVHILSAADAINKVPGNRQSYMDSINSLRVQLKKFIQSDRVFSGVYRDYLRRKGIEYESIINK